VGAELNGFSVLVRVPDGVGESRDFPVLSCVPDGVGDELGCLWRFILQDLSAIFEGVCGDHLGEKFSLEYLCARTIAPVTLVGERVVQQLLEDPVAFVEREQFLRYGSNRERPSERVELHLPLWHLRVKRPHPVDDVGVFVEHRMVDVVRVLQKELRAESNFEPARWVDLQVRPARQAPVNGAVSVLVHPPETSAVQEVPNAAHVARHHIIHTWKGWRLPAVPLFKGW